MCTKHFGIVLDNRIGFSLPNGTSPSLVVSKVIITAIVHCYFAQLALDNVGGSAGCLYSVGHQRSAYEQIVSCCAESLDSPVGGFVAKTAQSVALHIILETLLCHFLNDFLAECFGCCFSSGFGYEIDAAEATARCHKIHHERWHIACHYACPFEEAGVVAILSLRLQVAV